MCAAQTREVRRPAKSQPENIKTPSASISRHFVGTFSKDADFSRFFAHIVVNLILSSRCGKHHELFRMFGVLQRSFEVEIWSPNQTWETAPFFFIVPFETDCQPTTSVGIMFPRECRLLGTATVLCRHSLVLKCFEKAPK